MKILYFTDPHIRANSPGSRLDDFPRTILRKLQWIGDYCVEKNIKTIIVGGDWLDRPDVANGILSDLTDELMSWRDRGISTYTILGNHDLYGYNPETFKRTVLNLLCHARILIRLSKEPIVIGNVSLTGVDAYYGLDKGNTSDYVDVAGDADKVKINVVHGFLDNRPWGEAIPMTFIDDILDTTADITLTGHEHSGFGIVQKRGKTFCNPGALARVSAGVGDVNLEVKVAVVDVEENGCYDVKFIPLPIDIARPSNEVLDREKLMEEKERKAKITSFSSIIDKFQATSSMDIYESLYQLVLEEGITKEMQEILRCRLEVAEEELKKGGNEE